MRQVLAIQVLESLGIDLALKLEDGQSLASDNTPADAAYALGGPCKCRGAIDKPMVGYSI